MNSSPYDRTSGFVLARFRRHPAAFTGIALSALWAAWVIYYVVDHRNADRIGWYWLARTAVSEIGSGVLLAAGIVWLIGLLSDRS